MSIFTQAKSLLDNLKSKASSVAKSIYDSGLVGVGGLQSPININGPQFLQSAGNSVVGATRALGTSVGQTLAQPYTRPIYQQANNNLIASQQALINKASQTTDPRAKANLLNLAGQINQVQRGNIQSQTPTYSNRDIAISGANTAGLALSGNALTNPVNYLFPLGFTALSTLKGKQIQSRPGEYNKATKNFNANLGENNTQNFAQKSGEMFGQTLPFMGLANEITSPLAQLGVQKFAPGLTGNGGDIITRTGRGAVSAGEMITLNAATGQPLFSNVPIAFGSGFTMGNFEPGKNIASMDKGAVLDNPTAKEATRLIKEYNDTKGNPSMDAIHSLRDIYVGKLGVKPKDFAKIPTEQAFSDLESYITRNQYYMNSLPGAQNFVGKNDTQVGLYDTKVEAHNKFLESNRGKTIDGVTIPKDYTPYRRTVTGDTVDINRLKNDPAYFKQAYESTFAKGYGTDEKLYKTLTKELVPKGEEPSGYLADLYNNSVAQQPIGDVKTPTLDGQQRVTSYTSAAGKKVYETEEYNAQTKDWYTVGDSTTSQKSAQVSADHSNLVKLTQKYLDNPTPEMKANPNKSLYEFMSPQDKKLYDEISGKPNIPQQQPLSVTQNNMTPVGDILASKPSGTPPITKPVQEKYAFNINKNRLNIPEVNKKVIDSTVKDLLPELQQAKGAKLSNQEVIDAAKTSDVLKRVVTREETAQFNAALLKTRQAVAAGATGKGVSQDFIEALKVQSSIASDWGRRGQALSIGADPILNEPMKNQIVQKLLDLGKNTDDIIKASEGVDFNNPKQVTAFYRQFVKPNLGEIVNESRYINLLSSPKTHITNAFSNLLQATVVSPGTKLFSGAVDAIGSTLTGRARQQYASEVVPYTKGLLNSLGEATSKMSEAFKGNAFSERPDVSRLPTGSKLTKPFQFIPRALEASDVFFRTLISGAEKESLAYRYTKLGKNISDAKLQKMADDSASYFVFRKALDPSNKTGQGHLLSNIDKLTESIYTLRKVPGVSWLIPFVQTPMNILKQGIEYSPLGVATLPGATNKTEQIGKLLLGSTVMAGTAWAIQKGDSTWAAPVGEKDKEAFYAAGRQPYSIKIGDQWVSYNRLGPLAYPMAMAAAIKYYTEQDPKSVDRTKIESLTKAVGGIAKFFSDQSYVQGLGDLVKTLQGDPTAAKQLITGIPSQMIPLSSLQRWVAQIIDPIYRKPSNMVESLKAQTPFLSKQVAPYTNPAGLPSERQNLLFNAFSPVGMTPANGGYENYFQTRNLNSKYDLVRKNIKDAAKSGDMATVDRLYAENKDLLTNGPVANKKINKSDKVLKAKDNILKDKTLSETQKQKLLKSLDNYFQTQ